MPNGLRSVAQFIDYSDTLLGGCRSGDHLWNTRTFGIGNSRTHDEGGTDATQQTNTRLRLQCILRGFFGETNFRL